MRLLLDTHILLWALTAPERLPAHLRDELDEAEVYVSAASIWEVAIKFALGKISIAPALVADAVVPAGFQHLRITGTHAARVADLPPLHRDPFDRLLVAQALTEPLRLVTRDAMLTGYGDFITVI